MHVDRLGKSGRCAGRLSDNDYDTVLKAKLGFIARPICESRHVGDRVGAWRSRRRNDKDFSTTREISCMVSSIRPQSLNYFDLRDIGVLLRRDEGSLIGAGVQHSC